MSKKKCISNLSATYADVRRLDVKKINLKGKNILEYIEENTPTIKHSQDTRETVTLNDLWGQYIETKDDGTIIVHDDWVTNPNASDNNAWLSDIKAIQDNKAYSEITVDANGNFTGVVEDSVVANIQTDKIKNGTRMFYDTTIISFKGDLSNLHDGTRMFLMCSITTFDTDLSSLVNGSWMFHTCDNLTSFSGDLSNLINGENMFNACTKLITFDTDLRSLTSGYYMFNFCPKLTSFKCDLPSLTDGRYMFSSCTNLASFSGDLSSLNGGGSMFSSCTNLASFSGGDLSNLVDGSSMFSSCTSLPSFNGDLSNLINGLSMFYNCTNLTSFSGDLSSLVGGVSMFAKSKLTPQSVMYIVESIRNITEEKAKYSNGAIPWVTYDSTTRKYSAPFGFMENGEYVYTYDSFTVTISSSRVGKLTLGINVTNDPETIDQQLQTFAEGCLCSSWDNLKQEFANKGWTVTFQYGGTATTIAL